MLAGVGEFFDTLLVTRTSPPERVWWAPTASRQRRDLPPHGAGESVALPVTIAAHPSAGELVVLVEVLDGALGELDPAELGRRVIAVAQRLIEGWDRPLREVSILLDEEDVTGSVLPPVRESARRSRCERGTDQEGITARIAAVASGQPDAPALSWDGGQFSYLELTQAAGQLAALLTEQGNSGRRPVAIQLPRGPRFTWWPCWRCSRPAGMIVPLDPTMPADRIADIRADRGSDGRRRRDRVPGGGSERGCGRRIPARSDRARAGRPRGVHLGHHRSPQGRRGYAPGSAGYSDDHIRARTGPAAERLGRRLRVAHAWSFTFDAAWQPLIALFEGHVAYRGRRRTARCRGAGRDDPASRDDMIDTTPSMFAQLHHAGLLTEVPLTSSRWAAKR